jgi:hypothetical protein
MKASDYVEMYSVAQTELIHISSVGWHFFTLNGCVKSHSNRYWCSEMPLAVHEVPLHDLKVGVWCVVSAQRIQGAMFLDETSSYCSV